jgi:hypothetical protein
VNFTPSFASVSVARVLLDIWLAVPLILVHDPALPCGGHKFSGDIKGLEIAETTQKLPFLLA